MSADISKRFIHSVAWSGWSSIASNVLYDCEIVNNFYRLDITQCDGFGLNTFKWHEYYTKKVKVVTFQPQKVIFHEFQRNNNGWSLCQLSVNLTTNLSCQLYLWVFVSCQLLIFLAICQLSVNPSRTSCLGRSGKYQLRVEFWMLVKLHEAAYGT